MASREQFFEWLGQSLTDVRAWLGAAAPDSDLRDDLTLETALVLWRQFEQSPSPDALPTDPVATAAAVVLQTKAEDTRCPLPFSPDTVAALLAARGSDAAALGTSADDAAIMEKYLAGQATPAELAALERGILSEPAMAARLLERAREKTARDPELSPADIEQVLRAADRPTPALGDDQLIPTRWGILAAAILGLAILWGLWTQRNAPPGEKRPKNPPQEEKLR